MSVDSRLLYNTHLLIGKELSAKLSDQFKDSFSFDSIEVDFKKTDLNKFMKDKKAKARVFYSDKGRGFFVFDNDMCEALSNSFLGLTEPKSVGKLSSLLIDFLSYTLSDQIKKVYEKFEYEMSLDNKVIDFKSVVINKGIEQYNIVKMKLYSHKECKGSMLSVLPASD